CGALRRFKRKRRRHGKRGAKISDRLPMHRHSGGDTCLTGPLSGLTIIDHTRVLAGPFCTMMLAELGARVIKVEEPGKGDDSRAFAPFHQGQSAYFLSLNREKESIALDLKNEADRAVLLDLVRRADVVVENFRPGTLDRLGLGYERLRLENKRL